MLLDLSMIKLVKMYHNGKHRVSLQGFFLNKGFYAYFFSIVAVIEDTEALNFYARLTQCHQRTRKTG